MNIKARITRLLLENDLDSFVWKHLKLVCSYSHKYEIHPLCLFVRGTESYKFLFTKSIFPCRHVFQPLHLEPSQTRNLRFW